MRPLLVLLGALVFFVRVQDAAEVLGLFQAVGRSQWVLAEVYLRALEQRGHHITVLTTFPSKSSSASSSWTEILIPNPINAQGDLNVFEEVRVSPYGMMEQFIEFGESMCRAFLGDENVQKLYKSGKRFDVVVAETIFTECLHGFGYALKAPVVVLSSFSGTDWMAHAVGNPVPYAYVPNSFLPYTTRMTFFERMINTAVSVWANFVRELVYLPMLDSLIKTHLNDSTLPKLSEIERQTSLLLVNYHFTHGCPRPLVPNMIEVGGLHVREPKKLPEDIQAFLDEAKDGAIYFSMGSNVKSAHWPEKTRSVFIKVFSKLKQRVLWKWELDTLPGQPPNVKIGKWLPQSDILAHKNVRAFMTHGGLLSTQEATARGVPLVGIPVMADQLLNMAVAEQQGYAVILNLKNITEASLQWALNEILNVPRYRENVQRLSRIFTDRPMDPLDEAVYWTEYVIRHRGAPHLRSAALDLAWYQYFLLDVVGVLLAAIIFTFVMIISVTKFVLRMLCGDKRGTIVKSGKKSTKRD